ncbi:BA14K family protein [Corticibacterium sp. UT-5YL-CI-8]|nr:BA14K family protein [Tianweitania sp. UT-5YL-CI-8]
MSLKLYRLAKSGLVALGLLGGLAAPALAAAPFGMASSPAAGTAAGETSAIKVDTRCRAGDNNCSRWERERQRDEGKRRWDRDRDRDGPRWDRDRDRRDSWRRNDGPRHWSRPPPPRHYGGGPGIYFEFGRPAYREPPRYVAPRPVYRARLSQSHVNWCYNRYRSYRAWDNSFQPYGGPRQQCWSPFS